MKQLIDKTSPLYLKQLVRELNAAGIFDGFYANIAGERLRSKLARLKGGTIEVRGYAPEWFTPSSNLFTDYLGREIVVRTSTPMKNFDHIHDINELIPLQDIKRQFRFNSLDLKPRGKGNKAARRLMKLTSFSVYVEARASGLAPLANNIYLNAALLMGW